MNERPIYLLGIHEFVGRTEDELDIHRGDYIELIEDDSEFGDSWYIGRNLTTGAAGLFPQAFTTQVDELPFDFVPIVPVGTDVNSECLPSLGTRAEDVASNGFRDKQLNESMQQLREVAKIPKVGSVESGGPMRPGPGSSPHVSNSILGATATWTPGPPTAGTVYSRNDARQSLSVRASCASFVPHSSVNGLPMSSGSRVSATSNLSAGTDVYTSQTEYTPESLKPKANYANSPLANTSLTMSANGHGSTPKTRTPAAPPRPARPPSPNLISHTQLNATIDEIDGMLNEITKKHANNMKSVLLWTPTDVQSYFLSRGFDEETAQNFVKHRITGKILIEMDISSLKEVDIMSFGTRYEVDKEIQLLRQSLENKDTAMKSPGLQPSLLRPISKSASPLVDGSVTSARQEQLAKKNDRASLKSSSLNSMRNPSFNRSLPSPGTYSESKAFPWTKNDTTTHHDYASEQKQVNTGTSHPQTEASSPGAKLPNQRFSLLNYSFSRPDRASPKQGNVKSPKPGLNELSLASPISQFSQETLQHSRSTGRQESGLNGHDSRFELSSNLSGHMRHARSTSAVSRKSLPGRISYQGSAIAKNGHGLSNDTHDIAAMNELKVNSTNFDGAGARRMSNVTLSRTSMMSTSEYTDTIRPIYANSFSPRSETRHTKSSPELLVREGQSPSLTDQKTDTKASPHLGSPKHVEAKRSATLKILRSASSQYLKAVPLKQKTSAFVEGIQQVTAEEAARTADFSGWMYKRGGLGMGAWRARFFTLHGTRLSYFSSFKDTKERGLIDITGHRVMTLKDHDKLVTLTSPLRGKFCFKLIPPAPGFKKGMTFTEQKTHFFSLDTYEDMHAWMAALMKATIERDESVEVVSSCKTPTVSLTRAQELMAERLAREQELDHLTSAGLSHTPVFSTSPRHF